MDERAAVGAGDIDMVDLAEGQRIQRLPDIERHFQRAGEKVHRAGGNDAERNAILPGDRGSRRNRAVAATGNDAVDIVAAGGAFHGRNDLLAGKDDGFEVMPSLAECRLGLPLIGFHIRGAERAAILVKKTDKLHAVSMPPRRVTNHS